MGQTQISDLLKFGAYIQKLLTFLSAVFACDTTVASVWPVRLEEGPLLH